MKQLLLVLFVSNCLFVEAQFGNAPVAKTGTATTVIDDATAYYNLGWDNYKLDSMGPARYYWELASTAKGKSTSKNAALYRLGLMQQNGEGVDTNLNEALAYYKRAAAGVSGKPGDKDAIKAIGGFYENGFGVEQNYRTALTWYLKAKQVGSEFVDDDIKRVREKISELKPVYKSTKLQ